MPGMVQPRRCIKWNDDGTATVTVWPLFDTAFNTMTLPLTQVQWDKWQSGEYIQVAMPHLTDDEREFLMSGLTPEQFDALWPEEEEQ